MRLPMKDDKIDNVELCKMVDFFMERGFNYFDTAHGYHNSLSEVAVRECLSSRYPSESYVLTNKLSSSYFKTQEEIRTWEEEYDAACDEYGKEFIRKNMPLLEAMGYSEIKISDDNREAFMRVRAGELNADNISALVDSKTVQRVSIYTKSVYDAWFGN
jgi:aryl-alcohol dehydrogenase-like predicted oxidoreductase